MPGKKSCVKAANDSQGNKGTREQGNKGTREQGEIKGQYERDTVYLRA